jgi:hypothetical protein
LPQNKSSPATAALFVSWNFGIRNHLNFHPNTNVVPVFFVVAVVVVDSKHVAGGQFPIVA